MLVITRKPQPKGATQPPENAHDTLVVASPGGDVVVTVCGVRGDKVQIGIEAPREWPVFRAEARSEWTDGEKRRRAAELPDTRLG